MPSEIERISSQSPYTQPAELRHLHETLGFVSEHIPPILIREIENLRNEVAENQMRLYRELTEAYQDLSTCVNTLFDRMNRLPIMPEVTTPADGILTFTNEGSGVISIDIGQQFLVRGNTVVDTDDWLAAIRRFTTSASKTYHARWDADNGLRYIDTTDTTYNPGALPEFDASFDSTETDVFLGKITTDGANTPTFTTVKNKARLIQAASITGTNLQNSGTDGATFDWGVTYDWARVPQFTFSAEELNTAANSTDDDYVVTVPTVTRYAASGGVTLYDWANALGKMHYIAIA